MLFIIIYECLLNILVSVRVKMFWKCLKNYFARNSASILRRAKQNIFLTCWNTFSQQNRNRENYSSFLSLNLVSLLNTMLIQVNSAVILMNVTWLKKLLQTSHCKLAIFNSFCSQNIKSYTCQFPKWHLLGKKIFWTPQNCCKHQT